MDGPLKPDPRAASIDALAGEAHWIRGLALGLLGDEMAAEDVSQEVLLAALDRPRGLSGPQLRAWLATVTRRLAWSNRRRERARPFVERQGARPETVGREANEHLELHKKLVDSVSSLPEPYRTAIVLRYLEGRAPATIAKRLAITPETARKRVSRGLELLRKRLDGQFEGGRQAWCLALAHAFQGEGAAIPLAPTASYATSHAAASATSSTTGVLAMLANTKLLLLATLGLGALGLLQLVDGPAPREVADVGRAPTTPTETVAAPQRPEPESERAAMGTPVEGVHSSGTPAGTARIYVRSEAGQPIPGARLAWLDDQRAARTLALNASGSVERPAGSEGVELYASAPGHSPTRTLAGESGMDVEIVLEPSATLRVQLLEDGGPPGTAVRLKLWSREPEYLADEDTADLLRETGIMSDLTAIATGPDGRLEIRDLPQDWRGGLTLPSTHMLVPAEGSPVEPYSFVGERVNARAGDSLVLETLRLPTVRARLVWQDDGSPYRGKVLVSHEHTGVQHTEDDGTLELGLPIDTALFQGGIPSHTARARGLRTDRLELHAFSSGRPSTGLDKDTFDLSEASFPLDLGVITVIPAPGTYVRVLDLDGQPIEGASVASSSGSARTDNAGEAKAPAAEGESLSVLAPGFALQEWTPPAGNTRQKPAEVRLRPGHALTVHLLEADKLTARGFTMQIKWRRNPFQAPEKPSARSQPFSRAHSAANGVRMLTAVFNPNEEGSPGSMTLLINGKRDYTLAGLIPGRSLEVQLVNGLEQVFSKLEFLVPEKPGISERTLAASPPDDGRSHDSEFIGKETAALHFRIVDEHGADLDGQIMLRPHGGRSGRGFTADGWTSVEDLLAGSYRAKATARGRLPLALDELYLPAGQTSREFTLVPARSYTVRVVQPGGAEAIAEWVEA